MPHERQYFGTQMRQLPTQVVVRPLSSHSRVIVGWEFSWRGNLEYFKLQFSIDNRSLLVYCSSAFTRMYGRAVVIPGIFPSR